MVHNDWVIRGANHLLQRVFLSPLFLSFLGSKIVVWVLCCWSQSAQLFPIPLYTFDSPAFKWLLWLNEDDQCRALHFMISFVTSLTIPFMFHFILLILAIYDDMLGKMRFRIIYYRSYSDQVIFIIRTPTICLIFIQDVMCSASYVHTWHIHNNCTCAAFLYPFVRSVVEYQTQVLFLLLLYNIDLSWWSTTFRAFGTVL